MLLSPLRFTKSTPTATTISSSSRSSITITPRTRTSSTKGVKRYYHASVPLHHSTIKTIGVIGSGQMGRGIAKVAITNAKTNVLLLDNNQSALSEAIKSIESLFSKDVSKGKITSEESNAAFARLKTSHKLDDLHSVDFLIEAVSESPSLKESLFREVDRICPPHAILASNTSSITITSIAAHTNRPHKVVGMHFMNPVPVMKLVEIIPSLATSQETIDTTIALAHQMDKVTTKSNDIAGFIANRLLCPYLNEAFYALQEGLGTKEDIDTTMKLGCNMPMGPLTLADFIGLDTVLAILRVLHNELGDKYKPAPLLVRHVEAGWLGKKSGRGVFLYEK